MKSTGEKQGKKAIHLKKFYILTLLITTSFFAQIKGKITDDKGQPLSYVSVNIQNAYTGTTSNEKGEYELFLKNKGEHTLLFQYLGFKTVKKTIQFDQQPFVLNIQMTEENFNLNEVIITTKNNPANSIIKNAIKSRKNNTEKTARFTADFYSRGMFTIKNLPKKILGMKIDMPETMSANLDSTGSGILYLSETVSKISYEKPNHFKEKIIASKISGNDKGFSYNTALSSFYDFYENTVDLNVKMISPIASNAFEYYKFKLESTFTDENHQLINKIKIIPLRDKEPVFEGYIYIVEDSWAIYAVDLDIKGYRMRNEFTEKMVLQQNFNFNSNTKIWSKNSQILSFTAGFMGISFSGKFNYIYSNYDFPKYFDKSTFGNEIVSFELNANKKENSYWQTIRPIPLTIEESQDYQKKDSLQTLRNSKTYLDSIDKKNNKFQLTAPIVGYTYKNSFQKWSFNYSGLLNMKSFNFNTVQGYHLESGLKFKKWDDNSGKISSLASNFTYGFSENKLRISGIFSHRFNNQNYATLEIKGGSIVKQFNENNPISAFVNSISSLFFKENYLKLYQQKFIAASYFQDIANGISLYGNINYMQRSPLFNTTLQTFIKNDKLYTSNNPLAPSDYSTPAFTTHNLVKANINCRINLGNQYISRPDGRFNIRNEKLPSIYFFFEKTFAGSDKKYEYDFLGTRIEYDLALANKGILGLQAKSGKFWNADQIAFMDYKHFNGNQTYIGITDRYLNVFNLLPYYSNSTNNAYFEWHSEYNDQGYIMNKIPLLNLLKTNLIVGFHNLSLPNQKPYFETSVGLDNIGFGKFRQLRLDYVRSYQSGQQRDGIVFGLKFLNLLD